MPHFLADTLEISDAVTLADGRIAVNARVSRANNVQLYAGSELNRPDMQVVRVYRPADEVFNTDSMRTFPHKVMTLGHPDGPAQFDKHATGWIGDEVARDGDFIRVPMVIAHAKAVQAYKDGVRELSVGYMGELDWTPGITDSGENYDARLTEIVVDHVAQVKHARGGHELRIGDWRAADVGISDSAVTNGANKVTTKTVLVDGIPVEVTDAGAQVIATLQQRLADERKAAADAATTAGNTVAERDRTIAARDAEIATLKAAKLDDAAVEKLVADRAALIDRAKKLADADYSGKSPAAIRKAAVSAKMGDAAIADKSDVYVEAMFDHLSAQAPSDTFRTTVIDSKGGGQPTDHYKAYQQSLTDAWKQTTKGAH